MSTVVASLNAALHRAFATDERLVLLGEDVLDPYGGAFRVTRGLSTAFPERVLTTPISEAGIVGVATGMALRGLRPVVEIMFGDFVTLIADQLINHAAKFRWMYGGDLPGRAGWHVPLIVRTPMGGRRGYGPTHSQSLEKLFLGVPGLQVFAPTHFDDPGLLLEHLLLRSEVPTLFIENKLQYLLPLLNAADQPDFTLNAWPALANSFPLAYHLSLRDAPPPRLTLTAYGYMAELARQAMLHLAYQHEIFTDLLIFTRLSPFELQPLLAALRQTGRLLALEEGTLTLGWGAEIVARAAESLGPRLEAASRLAGRDLPVPASGPLEAATLPAVDDIVQTVKKMV